MELIGTIVGLQVQRSNLKQGERPRRWFDPAPLTAVESLEVDPTGVVGVTADGERIVDVHNRVHPESKYKDGNGMSLGFTSHYARMRASVSARAEDGIAGENVIVQVEREFTQDDLPRALGIETAAGVLTLQGVRPIEPCIEFSRYLLGFPVPPGEDVTLPNPTVTATIASLRHGVRGYCVTYVSGPTTLRRGDRLVAL